MACPAGAELPCGLDLSVAVSVTGVGDGVTVGVGVGLGVQVAVGVGLGVRVAVGVGLGVRVAVGVGLGVRVAVGVGLGVRVAVGAGADAARTVTVWTSFPAKPERPPVKRSHALTVASPT